MCSSTVSLTAHKHKVVATINKANTGIQMNRCDYKDFPINVMDKMENILDKYEVELFNLLNILKECEKEERRILGVENE